MVKELELFSLGGVGGWFGRTKKHAFTPEPGQKCLNCDTELAGRYCHACSQDADTHHRNIFHLIAEAFEGLFHLDGRIWQTLPPLFFAPGRLGRDLIEGRMARHVPPLRIFLISLLVFMLTAEHKTEEMRHAAAHGPAIPVDLEELANNAPAPDKPGQKLTTHPTPNITITTERMADGTVQRNVTRNIQIFTMSDAEAHMLAENVKKSDLPAWFRNDVYKALTNPEGFFHAMFTWGHRLALLALPIVGLSLGLLYAGRKKGRRFFLYDHLLVSMNLLSFVFLSTAIGFLLPDAVMMPWGRLVLALWTVATFFMTLRGAYGSSILGAALKSIILWAMTGISFGILILAVMFISLTTG